MWRNMVVSGASVLAMAVAPAAGAAAQTPKQVHAAIQQVLDKSSAGWNAVDLDGFMDCYENAPTTSYVSGTRVAQGFAAIKALYGERFAGPRGKMGTLTLELLDLSMIGDTHAYVIGRFTLHRTAADGGDVSGITTLLFKRTSAGWRIVADHS